MKRFPGVSSALLLFVVSTGALAAASEPSDVVRTTTDNVLERIKNEKESLHADPGKMYKLVSELIFPHFDFAIMGADYRRFSHVSIPDLRTQGATFSGRNGPRISSGLMTREPTGSLRP